MPSPTQLKQSIIAPGEAISTELRNQMRSTMRQVGQLRVTWTSTEMIEVSHRTRGALLATGSNR